MKKSRARSYTKLSLVSAVTLASACMGQVDGESLHDEVDPDAIGVDEKELIACPTGTNASAQARAVASMALEIVNAYDNRYGWTVAGAAISSQFFRPTSDGTKIELVPTTSFPLNQDQAKAALAFAQEDASVAKYLVDGLKRCRTQTNGKNIMILEGLDFAAKLAMGTEQSGGSLQGMCSGSGGYAGTDPNTSYCFAMDWTAQSWCDQEAYTVRRKYKNWSPSTPTLPGDGTLSKVTAVMKRSAAADSFGGNYQHLTSQVGASSYTGSSDLPCTPFEGPNGSNPYFMMEFRGGGSVTNTVKTYEMEAGARATSNCLQIQSASNASGGKVVGCANNDGDSVTFSNVDGGSGGACSVVMRASNGTGGTNKLSLFVNGTDTGRDLTLAPTGGWNTFQNTAATSATLNAGTGNTLMVKRVAGDSPLDMDKLEVSCGSSSSSSGTKTFSDPTLYAEVDCRFQECIREIDVDPVAYMESGDSYDAQGLVGSQTNPFTLIDTALYAVPSHANDWASRVVNGSVERGQFATPVTLFGKTKYKYVKR